MSYQDEHFKKFAVQVESAIDKYGGIEEIVIVERQKKQIETLVALEKKFRKTLMQHPWGPGVYRSFIKMITEERGNILAARPFFRERQDVFASRIAKALRSGKEKALYPFNINYQFVRFVLNSRRWKDARIGTPIVRLAEEIRRLRTEIVEMNTPLAISRARIFWDSTPPSHLSFMDLIQISCEGLMSAVDKFVPPYSTVFRSVAIGRIVGNFIESYSETLIHFYPQDKRKIYRANKNLSRMSLTREDSIDFDKLANLVNRDVEGNQLTNSNEISSLVAASSHVSTDSLPTTEEKVGITSNTGNPVDRYADDTRLQPDNQFEDTEARHVLKESMEGLTLFERKLLRMKGIHLEV